MVIPVFFRVGMAAGCLLAGSILLHYFQLESYQHDGADEKAVRGLTDRHDVDDLFL